MGKVLKGEVPANYNQAKLNQTITECLPLPYELTWEEGSEVMLFAVASFMLVFREYPAIKTSCFTVMTRATRLGDLVTKELLGHLEYGIAKYFAMSIIRPLRTYLERRKSHEQNIVAEKEVETASENSGGVKASGDAETSGDARESDFNSLFDEAAEDDDAGDKMDLD
jgi:hypothetical protein